MTSLLPGDLLVFLGRHNLSSSTEQYWESRKLKDIFVQPEWNRINDDKWDADIAMLVLEKPIAFSNYIQPVCLPIDSSVIEDQNAVVVSEFYVSS